MSCYSKNKHFASCQKNCTPDGHRGWQCEKLGGSVAERPPMRRILGGKAAVASSLFCFLVVTPDTYEVDLVHFLQARGKSVFACDTSGIFYGKKAQQIKQGNWQSVINTDIFLDIWNQVRLDGRYKMHDWTVKVDPDCVFFADRLRQHLKGLGAPQGSRLYVKNMPSGPSDWDFGFAGPLEVFTREAMDMYFETQESCSRHQGHKSGEDYYMKTCMDALGVGYMSDPTLLKLNNDATSCRDSWTVGFHAFKGVAQWMQCYKVAVAGRAPPEMRFLKH